MPRGQVLEVGSWNLLWAAKIGKQGAHMATMVLCCIWITVEVVSSSGRLLRKLLLSTNYRHNNVNVKIVKIYCENK